MTKHLLNGAMALAVILTLGMAQNAFGADEKNKRPSLWERSGSANLAGWMVAPKPQKKAPKAMGSKARVIYSDEKLVVVDPF